MHRAIVARGQHSRCDCEMPTRVLCRLRSATLWLVNFGWRAGKDRGIHEDEMYTNQRQRLVYEAMLYTELQQAIPLAEAKRKYYDLCNFTNHLILRVH